LASDHVPESLNHVWKHVNGVSEHGREVYSDANAANVHADLVEVHVFIV